MESDIVNIQKAELLKVKYDTEMVIAKLEGMLLTKPGYTLQQMIETKIGVYKDWVTWINNLLLTK